MLHRSLYIDSLSNLTYHHRSGERQIVRTPCPGRAFWLLLFAIPIVAKHGGGEGDEDGDGDAATAAAASPASSGASSSTTPSEQSSSTTSAPGPPVPTSSPIQLFQPANTTTCQELTLRWQSDITTAPLTLMITNDRAVLGAGQPAGSKLVSRILTTNISATATQYTWSPVDVPQGAYVAVAFDTPRTLGITAESPPFVVLLGQDTTCLTSTVTAALVSSFIASSASNPTAGADASEPPVSIASSNATGSQIKVLSPGALGGTVAGVTLVVVSLVLALTLSYYRENSLTRRPRNSRPGGPYYLF
ncbi:hypothetical protein BD414DRAFT_476777 [Trametes punicea]|nr:hypothetical protein BD414DRAFT_476777 [Trametes punicea]